jgi:uncharacterized protein
VIIGVLADTHLSDGERLPRRLLNALGGVDLILHAGDIVSPSVLGELSCIAPVEAVLGNCDPWSLQLPPTRRVQVTADVHLLLGHRLEMMPHAIPSGARVVIHGHTHEPQLEWIDDVLFLNPGSPTRPRGGFGPSIAILRWDGRSFTADHQFLDGPGSR